jgi:mRNA interferase MazF
MENHFKSKFKIVLVPFPFSENPESVKVRPALCLTEPQGIKKEILIAYITSQIDTENLESDLVIKDYKKHNLKNTSKIKLHKCVSITANLIKQELSIIDSNLQKEVKKKLIHLLELN